MANAFKIFVGVAVIGGLAFHFLRGPKITGGYSQGVLIGVDEYIGRLAGGGCDVETDFVIREADGSKQTYVFPGVARDEYVDLIGEKIKLGWTQTYAPTLFGCSYQSVVSAFAVPDSDIKAEKEASVPASTPHQTAANKLKRNR